jgi:hypothetical protein
MGEGMVKKLRELLPLGLRDSWVLNLLEIYYRNQALNFSRNYCLHWRRRHQPRLLANIDNTNRHRRLWE